jgi:ornithine cyclodeaminase/alanine dehydrogenase-like protein (mu-crystallin family)
VRERTTRLLSRRDVTGLLDPDTCRVAVEEAFRQHGAGEAPPPGVLGVAGEGGGFHIKAGTLRGVRRYFAAKVNGNFSGNERLGLPRIQGVIVLCDAEDGSVLAVMDSSEITRLRTAAATAVAARRLARPGSKAVTIVGCGVQGRAQLRALARVLPLMRAFALDEREERAREFAAALSIELAFPVSAVRGLDEALAGSDVCVTCTPSRVPFLFEEHVRPGTFVAAVGADSEEKQEIDCGLLASATVVTDVTAQCAAFGDLQHAIRAGLVSVSDVHAELGEIVAGKRPGRASDDEVIVFDSTGMALQDVAAAAAALERAEAGGIGILVALSG